MPKALKLLELEPPKRAGGEPLNALRVWVRPRRHLRLLRLRALG